MSYLNINKLKISTKENTLVDISFNIKTSTALVGESGSGKSLTLKSILQLLPSNLNVNIDYQSDFELLRKNIAFIPQNPFTSLSPMTKIKKHFFCSDERTKEVLKLVDLDESVLNKFPNQLSGGQIQRIVIAIAISEDVKLLLLDEPTTALDLQNRDNIINLIRNLHKNLDLLILFVTHDIDSISSLCDEIVIINKGSIIETGNTKDILDNPNDDYTKRLINSTFSNKNYRE
ncbi:MAG: ATP-binding cassette domain-containing protein [Sulfurovum sp.]|jgi:peptide/nickel transport system ATP-binding protein